VEDLRDKPPAETTVPSQRSRVVRLLARGGYWLAVLIVSIAILVALILFLESRDSSSVDGGMAPTPLPLYA
jgi:hypothetical protein